MATHGSSPELSRDAGRDMSMAAPCGLPVFRFTP